MYVDWLVKVINHLSKIEREQAKTKEKGLASLSRKSDIKIMVSEWFDEDLPQTFFCITILDAWNLLHDCCYEYNF